MKKKANTPKLNSPGIIKYEIIEIPKAKTEPTIIPFPLEFLKCVFCNINGSINTSINGMKK